MTIRVERLLARIPKSKDVTLSGLRHYREQIRLAVTEHKVLPVDEVFTVLASCNMTREQFDGLVSSLVETGSLEFHDGLLTVVTTGSGRC